MSDDCPNGMCQVDFSKYVPPAKRAPTTTRPGWAEPRETITLEEELVSRNIDVAEINAIIIRIASVGSEIDVHDVIEIAAELPPHERAYYFAGFHQGLLLGADQ